LFDVDMAVCQQLVVWHNSRMSAIGYLPELHKWVNEPNDHDKEIWLHTTAAATFDRVQAGCGRFMSIDEARGRLNSREQQRAQGMQTLVAKESLGEY